MTDRLPIILSTTALVVAVLGVTPLGDAAYNAVVPKNSVGTAQLKRNAVTSSKLAPNTVRASQVVDGSLLSADFKPGQIPQGPKGDKGDRGPAGPVGISGRDILTATTAIPANSFGSARAICPAGKKVIGGAANVIGGATQLANVFVGTDVGNSSSSSGEDVYEADAVNANTSARTVKALVICANVAG